MLGFLNGCLFMFLGLLGEYMWRIYQELDRHADAVVEEILADTKKSSDN
jgi:hypothetical protein